MSRERCNPHPVEHDGTSQRQRLTAALPPEKNPVDGRDLAALIGYAERYATMLQYWDDSNRRDGDWRAFIEQDLSALVARIGREDLSVLRHRFNTLRTAAEEAGATALPAALGALYQAMVELAADLDGWYRAAPEAVSLHRELEGWIASTLGAAMRTVVAQAIRARAVNPRVPRLDTEGFHPLWQLDDVLPDASLFRHNRLKHEADLRTALEQLAQAHGQFLRVRERLLAQVPDFMQESLTQYPRHQPHMALLLAFLQLFGHAQEQLNRLTAEHLRFYYRRVLGLAPGAAVADRAHLVLEPAKNLEQDTRIAPGTLFKAGKDATGVERLYAADEALVLNRAQLDAEEGLKSVYLAMEDGEVKNIHAATDADSADGLGAELESEDGQWETFGGEGMPYAVLGFAVASPMLLLGEGERTIRIRFDLDEKLACPAGMEEEDLVKELRLNIIAQGSGEKGWVTLDIHQVELEDALGPCLKFRLHLDAAAPPLVAYSSEILDGGYATGHPLIRFILDNEGLPAADHPAPVSIAERPDPPCEAVTAPSPKGPQAEWAQPPAATLNRAYTGKRIPVFEDNVSYFPPGTLVRYAGKLFKSIQAVDRAGFRPDQARAFWAQQKTAYPYRYLQGLEVRGLRIEVKVRGMRNLLLENDHGVLDPAKPFLPFGPVPKAGSAFLIGSAEVFSKKLTEVRLELSWAGLPRKSFAAHYNGYGLSGLTSNQYFTATAGFLQEGRWEAWRSEPLFGDAQETVPAPGGGPPPGVERCLRYVAEAGGRFPDRDLALGEFSRYQAGMRQGFMRLQLDARDFGHALYPVKLAEAAIAQDTGQIPNAPYVPLISELRLGYQAYEEVVFRGRSVDAFADRVEQLFQIWPFGHREIWPVADVESPGGVPVERRLLPHFGVGGGNARQMAEGTLYVGFCDLDLSGGSRNLSVLVQVAEGSADPELPVQDVVWSYLVDDVWHEFEAAEILADGTNGLLRSGIIRFAMPGRMTDRNRTLPAGRHWIKASVGAHTRAVCRLIALHTQAVTVSLRDQGNDPNHLATPLPSGSIARLKERTAAVKKVHQPYASFGGRMAENENDFNIRVSERLRHKGRAITLFDYERLVLQRFPEIYKVKCINHADRDREHRPGRVRIIVVPDLRNRNAVDPLKPKVALDLLERIREYLDALSSDFVQIDVTNPTYQEIRVQFQVRFHSGYDQGYHLGRLAEEIRDHLSPWLQDEAAEIHFGGRIHRSRVLQFVERLEYVDFVTDFRMDQQIAGTDAWDLDVEEAVAHSAGAVLVSAPVAQYRIGTDVASCRGREPEESGEAEEARPAVAAGPRFLGNTGSRELHDLNRLTPSCHIDRIAVDRQRRFYAVADAMAMGYDLCAHCFGRERSRR